MADVPPNLPEPSAQGTLAKTPLPHLKKAPTGGAEEPAPEAPAKSPSEEPASPTQTTPNEAPHTPPTTQESGGAPAG